MRYAQKNIKVFLKKVLTIRRKESIIPFVRENWDMHL